MGGAASSEDQQAQERSEQLGKVIRADGEKAAREVKLLLLVNTTVPDVSCTNENSVVLNCSTHIRSYPGFLYKWTVPAEANVTDSLNTESLTVPQGHSGLFNCTVANSIPTASTVIVFKVSNVCLRSATPIVIPSPSTCEQRWIIGIVFGIIVVIIIAVVLGVLWKHGHFPKGRMSTSGSQKYHSEVCVLEGSTVAKVHSVDREYDSLDTRSSSEPTYAQLVLEQDSNSSTFYENFKST